MIPINMNKIICMNHDIKNKIDFFVGWIPYKLFPGSHVKIERIFYDILGPLLGNAGKLPPKNAPQQHAPLNRASFVYSVLPYSGTSTSGAPGPGHDGHDGHMVFLWFSYGFPMVFLWFSYGLPEGKWYSTKQHTVTSPNTSLHVVRRTACTKHDALLSSSLRPVQFHSQNHYPLVNLQKAMERSTSFNGKIHYKWPFSIAFLYVHQRVFIISMDWFKGKSTGNP